MSYQAQRTRLYLKDKPKVTGRSANVVTDGVLTDPYIDRVTYKINRPEVQLLVVPGFGKVEHQSLIEGRGEISIRYESRHAGKLEKKVKLE